MKLNTGCMSKLSCFAKAWACRFCLLAAGLFILAAAGCSTYSAAGGSSLTENGGSAVSAEVRLEVWTISLKPKFTAFMEGLFAEFERRHPGVHIDWIDLPQQNIMQKLAASIAGGVSPDLVNLNTANSIFLAQNHAAAPVSDYLTAEEAAEYFPGLWQAAAWRGKVFALPWYVSSRVLIYNRRLLSKAGWNSNPPANRAEVRKLAEDVKKKIPGAWGFFPVVRLMEDWRMDGLKLYDPADGKALFTAPPFAERLAWYADLYSAGLLPEEFMMEGYQGALERYKQGNLALLEAGPQMLGQIKADAPDVYANTDVAALPWSSQGLVPAAVMNFTVPQASRRKALAVRLALFLSDWENQLKLCKEVPLLPSTVRTAKDRFFTDGSRDLLQAKASRISLQQLNKACDFALSLPHARDLERTVNNAAESAVYGDKSPSEALQKAAEQWNAIVDGLSLES